VMFMKSKIIKIIGLIFFVGLGFTGTISPELNTRIASARSDEKIPVIVMLKEQVNAKAFTGSPSTLVLSLRQTAEQTQTDLLAFLREQETKGNVKEIESFWIVNAVAFKGTKDVIESVAAREEVEGVYPNRVFKVPPSIEAQPVPTQNVYEWHLEKIGIPKIWERGYRGSGVNIGILDTGIDDSHLDLKGKVAAWGDFAGKTALIDDPQQDPPYENPVDLDGHGTHCAGIMVGGNFSGRWIGVAPEAKLVVARIFDDVGLTTETIILKAMQWVAQFPNLKAVSNSWGYSPSTYSPVLWYALQVWRAWDILPVFAIGNDGPGIMTTNSPGDYPHVFGVGATDDSDQIASFSSRGPIVWWGTTYIKPDISAPGVNITSTYLYGGYRALSGTSMATPIIAGVAALVQQVNRGMSSQQIQNRIQETAIDLGMSGKDNSYGWGRVDAPHAVFLPPSLSGGGVQPISGPPSTTFTFSVTYSDPYNFPAVYVRVHIVNTSTGVATTYDMSSTNGRDYKVSVVLNEKGMYSYYFTASEGIWEVRDPQQGMYSGLIVNNPPILKEAKVEPDSSQKYSSNTLFTYSVVYSDLDGDKPQFVKLHIMKYNSQSQKWEEVQNSPFSITDVQGDDIISGVTYSYKTYLGPGRYAFSFEANDGLETSKTVLNEGPWVNRAPELSDAGIIKPSPPVGPPGSTFTYSVTYKDMDGDAAQYVNLHVIKDGKEINGSPFTMTQGQGSWTTGVIFTYDLSLSERGSYSFYFEASDGTDTTSTLPISGPQLDRPPQLSNGIVNPTVGAPGAVKFVFSVQYSDPDGDPAKWVRAHIKLGDVEISGSPFAMTSNDGKSWEVAVPLSQVGQYKFKFAASDGVATVETDWSDGPIVNNPPQLLNVQVSPPQGKVGDTFTFSVVYKDIDNDQPQNVKIIIKDEKGNDLPVPTLTPEGNNPAVGIKFSGSEVINQQGTFTVQFSATDGKPNGDVKSSTVKFGVGVILLTPTPSELDITTQRSTSVVINVAYLASQGVKLQITDPDNITTSKDVFTDATGNASLPLSPDKLGTWVVDATDKATGQSKGNATFSVKATNQFPAKDMVSLPFGFSQLSLNELWGGDVFTSGKVVAAFYDPSQPSQYSLDTTGATKLSTGLGFWMKTNDGNPITIATLKGSIIEEVPVPVSLEKTDKKYWNIVGEPYLSTLDISQVLVQYKDPQTNEVKRISLSEADRAGLVKGYFWGYDPSVNDYILIHPALSGDNRILKPWKGYWIRALQDGVQLVFTPATKSVEAREVKPEGWKVQLVAQSSSGKDTCNYLGMGDSGLLSGVEEPPALSGVQLYFLRNGERLAWDVREKAERAEWDVVVEGAGEITLSWPNLSQVPKGYALFLIDGDKRINMLTSSRYVFSSDGRKELKVVYERRASSLLISGLMAKAVRGGVNVSFSLSDSADVKVSVKGVDGRLIKEMTRSGVAGLNSVVWDGKDAQGKPLPAGVYLLEVIARSSDGSFVRGITMFNLR